MKSRTMTKELELSLWEDKSIFVEIEFDYYLTTYGEDIDGNRGIPSVELGNYEINIPKTLDDGTAISEEENAELYDEAHSTLMQLWDEWADCGDDYGYDD